MREDPDPSQKARRLDELRRRLHLPPGGGRHRVPPLGVAAIDAALGGGLPCSGLHEILAGDEGAATGFCAAWAGRLAATGGRPVLWALAAGGLHAPTLHAPGLRALGLDPEALVVAEARRPADLLWVMEEGLRSGALAAVVAEVDAVDLTAGRRLQLAAEEGGVAGLLLRRPPLQGTGRSPASAAVTRWHVAAAPGAPHPAADPPDGGGSGPAGRLVGPARWRLELVRCRGGRTGCWLVEWSHETGRFALVAALRDGPAEAPPPQPEREPARPGAGRLAPLGAA